MSQFFSKIRNNTVWVIGINQLFECGETLKTHNINDHADNDEDYCNALTLCKWSKNMKNITKINRGYGFNIYTFASKEEESLINGFMKSCQLLLPHKQNSFYIIPKDIMLLCLNYLGNHSIYYSAGDNNHGSCGLGYFDHDPIQTITAIPVKLNNITKVCIGSGGQSVIWIACDGCVYLNGANYNNQLGLMQHKQAIPTPTLSTFFKCKSLDCTDAASSNNYSMIVCNDGSVWSAGKGYFGELGHGSKQETSQFIAIEALQKYHIINVCTGSLFSLFLDEDGSVWSCGRNEIGQCGLAHFDTDARKLPAMINFPNKEVKIEKIKCGMEHSIAMDVCGNVYCWGSNEYGQCGIDTVVNGEVNDKVNVPTFIETFSALEQSVVINIKAGSYHSGSITGGGKYYIWGCNDYNECCLKVQEKEEFDTSDNHVFTPQCINSYVNQATSCANVVDMSLGDCNTMIIVSQPIFM